MTRLCIFIVLICCACSTKPEKPNAFEFEKGIKLAELKNKELSEISGIASSINNPGYLWTHNDSNNGAFIALVDKKLGVRLICNFNNVKNRDWEDIAVGPGPEPGKTYIYLGDIGDNLGVHRHKYIYRFEEPIIKSGIDTISIDKVDKITFQLPDKKKDTETLLINPKTKDLYVISKREEPVVVYELRYPQSLNEVITASTVGTMPLTQIVAGDFSADGTQMLLKNYQNVYYWSVSNEQSMEDILEDDPQILPYEEESQGESITFALDGSGYYTLSEKVLGEETYLLFYKRKD